MVAAEVLVAAGAELAEGPVWDPVHGRVAIPGLSQPRGLNDYGQVVGYQIIGSRAHASIWTPKYHPC